MNPTVRDAPWRHPEFRQGAKDMVGFGLISAALAMQYFRKDHGVPVKA